MNNNDYNEISLTAIVTSYPRTFTDIPYEKEIFDTLDKKIKIDIKIDKMLAPELEARFRLMSKLLDKVGIKQVIELAAGYSSRGLQYSQKGYKYIELDLDNVSNNKKQILSSFIDIPENLKIVSGNALNINDFIKCKKYFDKNKEVAILNEGLLRYLTFEEKKIVAQNIYNFLHEFGGVWITSDVTPQKFIKNQDKNLPTFNKSLNNISSRNSINHRFRDKNHINQFFGEIGFDVEYHYFKEVKNELISPLKLGLSDEQTENLIDFAMVVIMRLKK